MSTISDRVVTVIIDVADKTQGRLDGLKKSLLAIDAAAQRTRAKLAAIGNRAYSATIRLIDRVSQPGSRINSFLKNLANKTYNISMRLNDAVFGKIRSLEASLMRIAGRAYTVAVNLKDNVSGKLKGLTDGLLMGAGGLGVGMLGTAGIGYGAVNAAQAYMNFEKQMSKVQAIAMLDKDSTEMQALVQQAKDLGAKTAWTSQEVGFAMEKQAMAGWSPELIQKVTPSMLNMASAVGADLASASDIVTDAMTALGIRGDEIYRDKNGNYVNAAEHFNDMFARLITSANTDAYQAGEALKYGAPTIGAMNAGKDIQTRMDAARDALVMIGLQANSGIKGSMAGTGLNTIFNRMASENRNAYYALEAAGVKVKDERGDLYQPMEIMRNLRSALVGGMDVGHLMDFAEELEGTKLHADTRRKLTSLIEQAQKNGGKLGSGGLLKMSSMLAGTEHMGKLLSILLNDSDALTEKLDNAHGAAEKMANIQLQNLAGDLTMLGSAWDAFQRGFFEGGAGDGLRNFVQSLTEVIQRANELFKDGIQVGDIGKLIADVVDRLKNKFMELDGIGSILAGGALMAAFVKIGRAVQKVIGYIGQLKGLQIGQMLGGATGAKGGTVAAAASVGTMNVTAGVVNIAGKAGGVGGAAGGRRVGNTAIIDNYNATKERIRGTGAPPPPSMRSTFMSGAKGGAAFAGLFAALDFFNTKSMSAERIGSVNQELSAARTEYDNLRASNAPNEQLAQQLSVVQGLEADQARIMQENKVAERDALAGASGSVPGAAIGAGLGSLIGPLGTMVGGMLGGMIGDKAGRSIAELGGEETPAATATESKPDYFGFNKPATTETTTPKAPAIPTASMADLKVAEDASRNYYLYRQRNPWQHTSLADREQGALSRQEYLQKKEATAAQIARFDKINAKLNETGASPFQYAATMGATQDYYHQQATQLTQPTQVKPVESIGDMFDDLFFGKAAAASLDSESSAVTAPDLSAFEEIQVQAESFIESIGETFSGLGELITENLGSAFEGVGETFSTFTESIGEGLTGAFEVAGEMVSTFGATLGEGLTSALEGAGEMFTGFGELVSSALAAAQGAAESALASIGSAFESARSSIMSAWGELPGFFSGIFDGLGGVAAAAGSAIYSGLTSVIGAVIGAWQSAAATVSSIISSISSMASSVGSMLPSIGGGGSAYAEGGFVNSPTQALIGEAGAEVVIPLSSSKRSRALDLFNKTAAILGEGAAVPMSDFTADDIPELDNTFSGFTLDAPTPVATKESTSAKSEVSMGGINITFNISGADSPQQIMDTIKENLADIADKIAGRLGKTVLSSFNNMSLGH